MILNITPPSSRLPLPSFDFSGIVDKLAEAGTELVPAIIVIISVIVLLNFVVNVISLFKKTVVVTSTDGLSKDEVDSLKRLKRKEELRKELRELGKQDRKK